jgi:hypothetical protein
MATESPAKGEMLVPPRWLIYVIGLIFFIWVVCFCFLVKQSGFEKGDGSLTEWGQIGDALGALNALLTGLALVGLVYTAILQQKQTAVQAEQLRVQNTELVDQRNALRQQSREQFLTARLNVQTARIQLFAALQGAPHSEDPDDRRLEQNETTINLRKSAIIVDILAHEARLAFEPGPSLHSVEKEAIRRYFVSQLQWFVMLHDRFAKQNDITALGWPSKIVCEQIEFLIELYSVPRPDIIGKFRTVLELIRRHDGDIGAAVEWCRSADILLAAGTSPWV